MIVPAIVSLYNGVHRMKRAQELTTGRHPTLNGWIVLILFVFVLHVVAYGYMQAELNKAWQAQSSGALPTGEPTTTPATPTPEAGPTGSKS